MSRIVILPFPLVFVDCLLCLVSCLPLVVMHFHVSCPPLNGEGVLALQALKIVGVLCCYGYAAGVPSPKYCQVSEREYTRCRVLARTGGLGLILEKSWPGSCWMIVLLFFMASFPRTPLNY